MGLVPELASCFHGGGRVATTLPRAIFHWLRPWVTTISWSGGREIRMGRGLKSGGLGSKRERLDGFFMGRRKVFLLG
jgi:hypothetical protein